MNIKKLTYGICFLAAMFISTACTMDKVKNDCMQFDKGFIESCNKSCPPKCIEMGMASKQPQLTPEKVKKVCTEACSKQCLVQLEKVRPTQCKPKK